MLFPWAGKAPNRELLRFVFAGLNLTLTNLLVVQGSQKNWFAANLLAMDTIVGINRPFRAVAILIRQQRKSTAVYVPFRFSTCRCPLPSLLPVQKQKGRPNGRPKDKESESPKVLLCHAFMPPAEGAHAEREKQQRTG
jgi:hypothetical protein